MKGKLVLEDGTEFHGEMLQAVSATGEVVFHTSMTGYQEGLSDPSYCSQLLTLTYPMIGNCGVAERFMQSKRMFLGGLIIDEICEHESNWSSENSLKNFLLQQKIPCLYQVDTRAVTRKIRSSGTMRGVLVTEDLPQDKIEEMLAAPLSENLVAEVTTSEAYHIPSEGMADFRVAVLDFGVKQYILNSLSVIGCDLTVYPAATSADEILSSDPDGILLSNGPGDPMDFAGIIQELREFIGKKPISGIGLGHQLIALAMGAKTYPLKFGHRGSNQPVKDLQNGKILITSQNHGYAVDEDSLKGLPFEITHSNVNDGTVEGLKHKELPIFSVQYDPEEFQGSHENNYFFNKFQSILKAGV